MAMRRPSHIPWERSNFQGRVEHSRRPLKDPAGKAALRSSTGEVARTIGHSSMVLLNRERSLPDAGEYTIRRT